MPEEKVYPAHCGIEKLVGGGQGLGRIDGKAVFVWGALPSEEVEVKILKDKKNFSEGIAEKILSASKERIMPKEEHYLSCSPWQILSWAEEMKWKKEIIKENFSRLAKVNLSEIEIFGDEKTMYHYRNKIEYNFIYNSGKIQLAIFGRDTNELVAIDECCLGRKCLNVQAKKIVEWINKRADAKSFRKIVLRCNDKDEILTAIFVDEKIKINDCPLIYDNLKGVFVYFSDKERDSQLIYHIGKEFLTEKIMGVELRCGVDSFFQINVPIFCEALSDIGKFLSKSDEVIDFYAGVGAISLPLHDKFSRAMLVEENKEAIGLAGKNIAINKLYNCETVAGSVERKVNLIMPEHVLILDPPRNGLVKELLNEILIIKPKRLIYLSCDIATQARDFGLLKEKYKLTFIRAYNFFPRTPHVECLCVLELK